MSAELKVNYVILDSVINVSNGLHQGCTMAPTLFNLFFNMLVEEWHSMCSEDGVIIQYNVNGLLSIIH